jgi:8-oxo-dGTP pyrophosphatase MutT (NUDIX family)
MKPLFGLYLADCRWRHCAAFRDLAFRAIGLATAMLCPFTRTICMPRTIQTFEVSLKAAIFRNGKLLLLQEADTGYWELPGGRIDVGEEWLPHETIRNREITEELGATFKIRWLDQSLSWVRQRPTDNVFQVLIAQLADFETGSEKLSSEHCALRWTTPAEWPPLTLPPLSGYANALAEIWQLKFKPQSS